MMWEYKTIKADLTKGSAWSRPGISPEMIDRQLADLGHAGWELVTALARTEDGNTREVILFFKRATSQ